MLRSPVGPVGDGGPDYWFNFEAGNLATADAKKVLGYDRAMYATSDRVAVVFFDSHVEVMDVFEFEEMLDEEPNAGTDFNLP